MVEISIGQLTKGKLMQFVAALAATSIAFGGGTVLGWSSPTAAELTKPDGDYKFSSDDFSWIGSSLNLGAVATCLPIGILLNIIGRKWSLLILVIPALAGWGFILGAGSNLAMMIVGRVLLGMFAGCLFVVCPLYLGEIAEKEIRGILGTFMQLLITVGILFAYGVGAATNTFWFSLICMAMPVIFAVLFITMPETPTYYVSKNKIPEAEKSLKWLRGKSFDPSKEIEILKLEKEEREKLNETKSLRKSFSRTESKLSLLIVVGLMVFQQTSGINAVIFYTNTIFEAAGTDIDPATQTIIVGAIQVVMTLVATVLVDKLGRKPLLLTSDALMAICTIALGTFFYIKDNDPETAKNLGWLPITSLSIFIVAYSIGFGPIPFLVLGEICAPDIKGVAVGTALTVNWSLSFLITKFFDSMVIALGIGGTFWIYSGFSIVGTLFILVILPETKGISMEQIQLNLRRFKMFSF